MGINAHLFCSFMKIGGFTIGGGMAMLPIMERVVVDDKKWLTREEFLDVVSVSQSTPGVFAVDMASHIGYKVSGLRGGIYASLGCIVPSLVVILLVAFFFRVYSDNRWVMAAFMGIRPAVVALIALPVFGMAKSAHLGANGLVIAVVAALLIWLLGVSPVWIITVAGVSGYLYGRYKLKGGRL